jgi:glutamate dehydrogenase/leucine dehydrogenase
VFEDLLRAWSGEEAVIHFDAPSGAWIFVCVHSTTLGDAAGGTRMRVYPQPGDGLADAMKLSGAMTQKWAAADLPRGGGKAVLAVPELLQGEARKQLLRRYGQLVQSLGGTYRTAGDMNISPTDLDVVAERCQFVYGTSSGGGNSGVGTARACWHGIRASVEHVFGSPDLSGRSVLVQGVGAVGADLARGLAEAGAHVLVSDVDEARGRATGFEFVPADDAVATDCDVFSPCAVGGVLDADSIARLRCRIVAGSANNQLAGPEDAARMHERGILYAPDYVINAGGIIQLYGMEDAGWDAARLEQQYARVGETLLELFAEAERDGITPAEAADRLVARRLSRPAA